jgi:two-component system KDP operon response regulator KdpE
MKKILVIEDDKKIATALAIRLEAVGYQVMTAPDGFSGLKLAIEIIPDLIVMDIWMPVGMGFSVVQRLRSLGLEGVPIIFITASKLKGLRKTAEKLGAIAFFEKPYVADELLAAVAQGLQKIITQPQNSPAPSPCS